MEKLKAAFEKHLNLKIPERLSNKGSLKGKIKVNYILSKDSNNNQTIDFLIFDEYQFSPEHLRINSKGEIAKLDNFQVSYIYELDIISQKKVAVKKMKAYNKQVAHLLIKKGLAKRSDEWILEYL
ncbi:hypothetical protein [Psychroflexus salis]|uniref:Uncharacterized protein n=1 Tax=Psychroflexus salis TaxID=1526574 RepID=A0A917E8J0_9FLAO|nr:hypothetical protein [Psychroflexus salis]GGE15367.1 hypothetical protein GCM10010831_15890 [Psychroflexus salis]